MHCWISTKIRLGSVLLGGSLLLAASPSAAGKPLSLQEFTIHLPGAPATVVAADLDGDGIGDLIVVVAYTEWGQIVTAEEVEMSQVEGLVEMMTIVPALSDHREVLAFRGLPSGGFEAVGAPLALGLEVLSVLRGPTGVPVIALTDDGISELRLEVDEGQPRLALVPLLERRSVLSFSGTLVSDLELVWDFDGDGLDDLLFPSPRTLDVFLSTPEGLASTPVAEVPVPEDEGPYDRRRLYHLPTVADLDGDGLPDLLLRENDEWERFWVARSLGGGRFAPPIEYAAHENESDSDEDDREPLLVHFGDVDGDGRAEYVLQKQTDKEDVGWRKEIKQAKTPHFRYSLHSAIDDSATGHLAMDGAARLQFDAVGYGFGASSDEISLPFGLQDLDGDGLPDLVTVSLDFSLLQVFRILATKSLSIGMNFHVSCQQADGSFREVTGLDLSGKFKLRLDDLRVGRLSQFNGDFDGDGRRDFLQIGRGRRVSIHRGRPGCRYPSAPDLEIRLREEPKNLALVKVRDLDGDGLSDLLVVQPQAGSDDGATSPVRLDLYLSRGSG